MFEQPGAWNQEVQFMEASFAVLCALQDNPILFLYPVKDPGFALFCGFRDCFCGAQIPSCFTNYSGNELGCLPNQAQST